MPNFRPVLIFLYKKYYNIIGQYIKHITSLFNPHLMYWLGSVMALL